MRSGNNGIGKYIITINDRINDPVVCIVHVASEPVDSMSSINKAGSMKKWLCGGGLPIIKHARVVKTSTMHQHGKLVPEPSNKYDNVYIDNGQLENWHITQVYTALFGTRNKNGVQFSCLVFLDWRRLSFVWTNISLFTVCVFFYIFHWACVHV